MIEHEQLTLKFASIVPTGGAKRSRLARKLTGLEHFYCWIDKLAEFGLVAAETES